MAGGLKPTRGPFSQFAEGGNPLHDWITDKRGHYTVSSGHHDRPRSGRRQRHRHWLGGGGFAARAAHKGDPHWHWRGDGTAYRICWDNHTASQARGPSTRRGPSPPLGMLEDVARAARTVRARAGGRRGIDRL